MLKWLFSFASHLFLLLLTSLLLFLLCFCFGWMWINILFCPKHSVGSFRMTILQIALNEFGKALCMLYVSLFLLKNHHDVSWFCMAILNMETKHHTRTVCNELRCSVRYVYVYVSALGVGRWWQQQKYSVHSAICRLSLLSILNFG